MRDLKRISLFLILLSVIQTCLAKNQNGIFNFQNTRYSSDIEKRIDNPCQQSHKKILLPVTYGKVLTKKIVAKAKQDRHNVNIKKGLSNKREILGKYSNRNVKENIFKSILIALAWALVSVVIGVLLVVVINLLFPTISPQGVLLITLVVTVVLSVVIPRIINQKQNSTTNQ